MHTSCRETTARRIRPKLLSGKELEKLHREVRFLEGLTRADGFGEVFARAVKNPPSDFSLPFD
jgi:hypothetical protein